MGHFNREMKTIWKISKENAEIKTAVTQVKNHFDRLSSRLKTTEGRISEVDDFSTLITQTKTEREINERKNENRTSQIETMSNGLRYI